ncbi:MAG TPA: hypothetical protein PLW86_13130 [Rhodocyclaceae bacterium]|nr:hypothetical protein [Rhodocyclaceae bacterium]
MRPPLTNDVELQVRDQVFSSRQHSYDLTQKLTYFVIFIELVFCGYMLLNAEKLSGIQEASYLFLTCGIAAFFGITWRFFYNQTYHNNAHGIHGCAHQIARVSQLVCYWTYVVLSIVAFVWALSSGFSYIDKVNAKKTSNTSDLGASSIHVATSATSGSNSDQLETQKKLQNPSTLSKKNGPSPKAPSGNK